MKLYMKIMAYILFAIAAAIPVARALTHITDPRDVLMMALAAIAGALAFRYQEKHQ